MTPPNDRHKLLEEFLEAWPIAKIQAMTLEEYAIGAPNFKETFCYWLETYAKRLGNIKGISGGGSFKFGIFFKDPNKTYDSKQYTTDGVYAWKRTLGADRSEAFERVRKAILSVIDYSIKEEFSKIDEIKDLFSLVKWKIAFIYSEYKLLPIYKHDWLQTIAAELGFVGNYKSISELQTYIVKQKSADQDLFDWYDWILSTYIKSSRSYFLIGSNYTGEKVSKLNEFYQSSVIATGFLWEHSFQNLFNKSISEIDQALRSKDPKRNELEALRQFLTIKEGDVIAIKNYGIPDQLSIAAYAVATTNDQGVLYFHDPDDLGHCINVDFIETDVNLELPLTKTHTLHRIVDQKEIDLVFKAYQDKLGTEEEQADEEDDAPSLARGRKGTKSKHRSGYEKKGSRSIWVEEFHNNLQQEFFEWLKLSKNDPEAKRCIMEEDYVDITYSDEALIELYEVKTSPIPWKCMREAVGQLVHYSSLKDSQMKKLFVVGPGTMTQRDRDFLSYLQNNIVLPIEYVEFKMQKG